MALYFTGKSICPICYKVLEEEDEIAAFPAFVAYPDDSLVFFNDGAFHYKCLLLHPLGPKTIELANIFIAKTRPENRICAIGKNKITHPDDYLFIPLLTSNEREDLYKFNFINIDKNNIKHWEQKDTFMAVAKLFQAEGKWGQGSSYLKDLIDQLIIPSSTC